MYVVNTHLKPVIGIDIHFVNLPFPFVPIPHPYIGLVIDPFDYIPFIGATVKVNGVPRGNTDTMGMIITFVHIPFGAGFTLFPIIGHNSQNFFGSKKVMVDGAPMSGAGYMLMTCNDIGIPLSFRPGRKFIPIPSLYLPTSYCIPLQWGAPVNVGGPLVPNFSLLALLKAFVFGCFLKVLGKIAAAAMKKMSGKLSAKLGASGKLKKALCKMGFEPVDLVTGRVNYEYADFELPGPIPLLWLRNWDSDSAMEGSFGHGIHFCYDRYIILMKEEDAMALLLEDGRVAAFPWLEPGEEYYHRQEKLLLRRKQNGHFLLEDYNASLYLHFNHLGPSDIVQLSFIENYSGHRIQLHYDRQLLTAVTDSAGRRLLLHRDREHIFRVDLHHQGKLQTLVTYAYNEAGDLAAVTDALGQVTRMEYNDHLMVRKTDRNGQSFYWEYDEQHRCVHTWGDGGIQEGWIRYHSGRTEVTDSLGNITTYWYDENNCCVRETDHYGSSRYTEYTDDLQVFRQTDEVGNVTGYVYNEHGWLKERIMPDHTSTQLFYNEHHQVKLIIHPDGNSDSYGYDAERRLRFINYPNGQTTAYEYNDKGQVSAMVFNGKEKTTFQYDEDENLARMEWTGGIALWQYDHMGNCTRAIDAEGQIKHYEYDALCRLRRMYLPDGNNIGLEYNAYTEVTVVTDRNGRLEYDYTPLGNLCRRNHNGIEQQYIYNSAQQLKAVVNETGQYYRLEYNARGEIIGETGFDGLRRSYRRDAAGKVARVERPGGRHTAYEYDANGRIIRTEYHDGSWEFFRYDKTGNMTEASNEHTTIQFRRDKLGLVESEWQDEYYVQSRYDKLGNRVSVKSSLGAAIDIDRDRSALPVGLKVRTPEAQWSCQVQYNSGGQEIMRRLPGELVSTRSYDAAGHIGHHKVLRNKVAVDWKKYTWEAGDRLTSIVDGLSQTRTSFRQDAWNNLVFAQYADSAMVHRTMDETGNVYGTKDKSDRHYSTGGALLESRTHTYSYDEEGHLTRKTEKTTGKKSQYQWQANGMLARVIRPDGKAVCFKYDALGRRIEKTFDGKVTRYVWDGNTMLHEWTYAESRRPKPIVNGEGQLEHSEQEPTEKITTWVFDADGFSPAARLEDGHAWSVVCDYLGTPQALYDEEGKKSWEGVLDIYGRVRSLAGRREDMPFRYQGQYEDVETGLYYNRFRYYSPEEGTYISQDPIRLEGGTNTYSYVSDPNYWTDLLGLTPIFDDKLADMAKTVHNLVADDPRAFRSQTIAIGQGELPNNGGTQLFAAGSGARFRKGQRDKLIEMGVPEQNIYSGKAAREMIENDRKATRLANHAERVIIRNAPKGTKFPKWGISWAAHQKNESCANCKPHVECAS
ncbi:RHS repeat-associated core domain-containing protein [Flavitalea sp. BT771]|uniref:RHS repeat-associated core domain-containing protein n=1 Tax=Flavitalea sp. BT771 TaxID=3063329 RepID=UPI0026E25B3C|nr:RHS repeat-associated core domain-containing protein [Flavitalea sp. BT771]MDO6429320.1 RHS repeat-associated core domain-containing protein [Flavitalea sp. BT771]MDV6218552.1 RHS repeat-associated core domain-containing protein [Flavitalea sp. BT771]